MTAAAALSFGAYLLGATATLVVLGAIGWAAREVRATWLGELDGAAARLTEVVAALALLFVPVLAAGAVAVLHPWPVFVLLVVVSGAVGVVARRARGDASGASSAGARPPHDRLEVLVAGGATALVGAQWLTHVAFAWSRGMTHPDTLWYHGPFSAHMVQLGSFGAFGQLGYLPSRHFPLDSEVLHALVILPFDRDLLAPLVNLVFGGLALLAAWCIGRDDGRGALALLGVVMLLGMPTLAGTQPGQGSNDVMCAALLLAGVALVRIAASAADRGSGPAPAAMALGGIAVGLAIGTKLTIAAPVAALVLGTVWWAWRRGRAPASLAFLAGFTPLAAFWFVRNWVNEGNPVPFVDLHLGPIDLTATAPVASDTSIVATLSDLSRWGSEYLTGLGRGYGPLWPVVLVGAAVAGAWAVARGRGYDRVVGVTIVVGALGYPFLPLTGKEGFGFNLRYLTPTLVVAFAVLPLALGAAPPGERDARSRAVRRAVLALLAVVVVVNATAGHREGVPAWPSDQWLVAVVGGAVIAGLVLARLVPRTHPIGRRLLTDPRALAWATGAVCVLVVAGGQFVQRSYLEHRYVDAGLDDGINEYVRDVRDSTVALLGFAETYPLFGVDLSNRVTDKTEFLTLGSPDPADPCRFWRREIGDDTRYVAVSTRGAPLVRHPTFDQQAEWFADAPGVTLVHRRGDEAIYRVDEGLDPSSCPPTAPGATP